MNDREWWDNEARTDERYIAGRWGLIGDGSDTDTVIEDLVELIGEEVGLAPTGPVLEIGCGPGRLLGPLAQRFPARAFIGADISSAMFGKWLKRWPTNAAPMRVAGDGTMLPPDKQFGFIYSVEVFQHCEPEIVQRYMASAFEGLALGGSVLFQYVEGDQHLPYNHTYRQGEIDEWMTLAGFGERSHHYGLVHFEWNWVHAVKQP